jgi:preprotein translocase subunit SecE
MGKFFKGIGQFLKDSMAELRKVTWLSKEEALSSSVTVIIFVVVFSVSLAALDYLLNLATTGLLR